ncbi:MAG TPA: acyl-CoA dehydrogenase family protein, partial [Stellaceae bacterium]|nr:acyl-CoA dehydrogenase family protein [Stellaceae bacterium]
MLASPIAGDCRGRNFYGLDESLRRLLPLYLEASWRARLEPHFDHLGAIAGGRLDELAATADRHPPVLHVRDPLGRDAEWIEYHPSYREMEKIAFADFALHAMSHRAGVLGSPAPLPAVGKYVFQYLFVEGEFGLMCPISLTDTAIFLIRRHGSQKLKDLLLPRMLSADPAVMWKGAQFMTERAGGSDVGAIETVAHSRDGVWRLTGDKWFCSHADADVALVLARPAGAPSGTRGLALFALTRRLASGERNAYRIVRLKEKLGTRSMASGEIRLEGAVAHLIGEPGEGLKQMLDQVNLSRLSHGVRAAAMMRRCLNEALHAVRERRAFGRAVIEQPLMRRQLMKVMVPTEEALSMSLFTASLMDREDETLLRILTPLLKFRACRDNLKVASGAMEARGGNGYIEEWVTARLVRDAHVGVLWEGTSNIVALDLVTRAVGRHQAHRPLIKLLNERLAATPLPPIFRARLGDALERAMRFAESVARDAGHESEARAAASALYHATSAVLLAHEGMQDPHEARRALLSRFVLEHHLSPRDPLSLNAGTWENEAGDALLNETPMP